MSGWMATATLTGLFLAVLLNFLPSTWLIFVPTIMCWTLIAVIPAFVIVTYIDLRTGYFQDRAHGADDE